MSSSRENILRRLRQACENRNRPEPEKPDLRTSVYAETKGRLDALFQERFEAVSGIVIRVQQLTNAIDQISRLSEKEKWTRLFCQDRRFQQAMQDKCHWTDEEAGFPELQAGITPCEFLIARLGSVLVSSGADTGRKLHVFPPVHIVIAHKAQLVDQLEEALALLQKRYPNRLPSVITNITGPSRTADIEKTLVKGMHGPRKIIVILCDQSF
ncbi:MAG: lactate utilization protein C [Mangrovibacterium sp.]